MCPSTYFIPPPSHPPISCTDPSGGLDAIRTPHAPTRVRDHRRSRRFPLLRRSQPGAAGRRRLRRLPEPSGRLRGDHGGGGGRGRDPPPSPDPPTPPSAPPAPGLPRGPPNKAS